MVNLVLFQSFVTIHTKNQHSRKVSTAYCVANNVSIPLNRHSYGGGKIKHQHFIRHGIITKTAQRYKKIFNYATRTRIFLRIVTKNLRIVTLTGFFDPKTSIIPHRCKN